MTAHMGNWEIILPIISKYKNIMAVVRDQNSSGGNKFFYKARQYKNSKLISKNGSKKDMLNAIKNNYILALASDQNPNKKGLKGLVIDFFDKPCAMYKGAGHFYFQTKSRIVVGFCLMNKNYNYDFSLKYLDIEKYNIEQKEELIVKINEIYLKILEKVILEHPEQYFWFHKRWDKNIYDT